MPNTPEKNPELEKRIRLFNEELQALQTKYQLLLVAEIIHPSPPGNPSAVTNVPLTVKPMEMIRQAQAPQPSKPTGEFATPDE